MHATTAALDLAKDVFELAFADAEYRIEKMGQVFSVTASSVPRHFGKLAHPQNAAFVVLLIRRSIAPPHLGHGGVD